MRASQACASEFTSSFGNLGIEDSSSELLTCKRYIYSKDATDWQSRDQDLQGSDLYIKDILKGTTYDTHLNEAIKNLVMYI